MNHIPNNNIVNRMNLLMSYQNDKTLNENYKILLKKSNENFSDFVIGDMASKDLRYIVLLDEIYDTKTQKHLGNFWDSLDNIKLFLGYALKEAKDIPQQIKETYLRDLNSIILNESSSSQDLLILKENLKQFIKEADSWGQWAWGGVKDAANYFYQSGKDVVTGTTKFVGDVTKGVGQGISAVMRGDLKKLFELLKGGVVYFARYVRSLMYNPIVSIIDALLVFSGVGKAVQWIPWAIIVGLDIYEVINNDFEIQMGDDILSKAFRFLMIGCDILGLVTTGSVALAAKKTITPLTKLPKEKVVQSIAKNPTIKNTIQSMLNGLSKLPSKLNEAVKLLKPRLPKFSEWLSKMLQSATTFMNKMKNAFAALFTKKGATIAAKEGGIDYGMQKGLDYVTGAVTKVEPNMSSVASTATKVEPQVSTMASTVDNIQISDKTKQDYSAILQNYS
jgi:hypothetical protein